MEVMVKLTASCDDLVVGGILWFALCWSRMDAELQNIWRVLAKLHLPLPACPHTYFLLFFCLFCALQNTEQERTPESRLHCLGVPAFCLQSGFSQWRAAAVDSHRRKACSGEFSTSFLGSSKDCLSLKFSAELWCSPSETLFLCHRSLVVTASCNCSSLVLQNLCLVTWSLPRTFITFSYWF